MAGDGFDDAVHELYAADLDDFAAVRAALVARARKRSTAAVAKRIGALRKPTRSAWTVNQLARAAADELGELFALGDALRSAQSSLDGAQLRELSAQRRQVVEALVRQALEITGQPGASPGVRDEVRASLDAALADPDVRAEVAAGTLVRAAHWSGFGDASAPLLSVVAPSPAVEPSRPAARTAATGHRAGHGGAADRVDAQQRKPARTNAERAAARHDAERQEAERLEAERLESERQKAQQRERERRDEARAAVDRADATVGEAVAAEKDQQRQVRLAQDQLADARRRLDEVRLDLRSARNQQSKAVKALRELG